MHRVKPIFLRAALIVLLLPLALRPERPLLAAPAAVTFTVDTTDDRLDEDTSDGVCHTSVNTCALRAAIMQANHLTGPGVTTISLPSGTYTLTRPASGPDEEGGDLDLTAPLSADQSIVISGAGAASTIIDANQIDRVMHIAAGRTATITGVTLRNGYTTVSGGALLTAGAVTLSHSTLAGNRALGAGGGVRNSGLLTVADSTISGNRGVYGGGLNNNHILTVIDSTINQNNSDSDGGGIDNAGALMVVNSTISQNNADNDGGGLSNSTTLTVVNTTISQNNADRDGGGIFNDDGTANVYNTTIVSNGANADADPNGLGGGVFNNATGIFNLRNSLVAGNNVSNAPVEDDCRGTLGLYGVNLMGLSAAGLSNCTIVDGGAWTYLNDIATLGALQDNGGPTWTHALLPGSNAIDGDNLLPMACVDGIGTLVTDQRGQPRVVGAQCDVGAFEYSPLSYLYLPLVVR